MMIETTKGPMDESKLVKTTGEIDDENECTNWVEYRFEGELVHRSAHVTLKPKAGAVAQSEAARFS